LKVRRTQLDPGGWKPSSIALLCFMLSCASVPPWLGGPDCPVVPVSTMELHATARLRARARITVGNREIGFEVVAFGDSEELVVVGVAPQGIRLFAIRQRERNFDTDASPSREMKQLARWVMDALHRGLWIEPAADSRHDNGVSWVREGEQVIEVRRNGGWRREFRRAGDANHVAPIVIDYRDPAHPGGQPRFEIRNAWCGYEAVFIPLDEAD
jgi:hypothetical protein